jgi:hypothetical protein
VLGNVEGASITSKIAVKVDALLLLEVLVADKIDIFDVICLHDVNLAVINKLL